MLRRETPSNLNDSNLTDSQLIQGANEMNILCTVKSTNAATLTAAHSTFPFVNPVNISQISQECYFDIVCQVCAICESRGTKFLMVWDGTKSKYVFEKLI